MAACGKWRTETGRGLSGDEVHHASVVGDFQVTVKERTWPGGYARPAIWIVRGPRKPGRPGFCTVAENHAPTVEDAKRAACNAVAGRASRRDTVHADCAPGDLKAMSRRRRA